MQKNTPLHEKNSKMIVRDLRTVFKFNTKHSLEKRNFELHKIIFSRLMAIDHTNHL